MSRSDFALLAIAAYIAAMALVRLMKRRRDKVVAEVQRQVDARHTQKQHDRDKQRDAA